MTQISMREVTDNADYVPQTGSPFLISWPSLTRTSTTTPDIGAPTDPGSFVAFSRDTDSTAELLSSTDTARIWKIPVRTHSCGFSRRKATYLSIDFEPDITLSTALHNRTDGHQADNEGLALLNRYVHLLADVGTAQEVACGDNAVVCMRITLRTQTSLRTSSRRTSRRSFGTPRRPTPAINDVFREIDFNFLTFGYITYDVTSASVTCLPYLARSSALIFLKSKGARLTPGLPSILGLLRMMLVRRGSGKPPTG